jgi:hypothetical protein
MLPRIVLAWMVALTFCGCVIIPGSRDPAEASAVLAALEQRYEFPVRSKLDPSRPAAYARPAEFETVVSVIGVTTRAEQDRVVAILRDIRTTVASRSILVDFYPEEKLETSVDHAGASHTYRVYRGEPRTVRIE